MRVTALLFCFAIAVHTSSAFKDFIDYDMSIEEVEARLQQLEALEALQGEDAMERFGLGDMKAWLIEKAISLKDNAKQVFLENGGAEILAKGKVLLDKLQVQVDPVTCENNLCKSCISVNAFPLNGQSVCATFGTVDTLTLGCSLSVNGNEFFKKQLGLKALSAVCAPMPFPLGDVCLQGMEYSNDKEKEEKRMCVAVVLGQFSVGARLCATQGSEGLEPSVETLTAEAIAEQSKFLFKYDGKCVTSILSEYLGASEE